MKCKNSNVAYRYIGFNILVFCSLFFLWQLHLDGMYFGTWIVLTFMAVMSIGYTFFVHPVIRHKAKIYTGILSFLFLLASMLVHYRLFDFSEITGILYALVFIAGGLFLGWNICLFGHYLAHNIPWRSHLSSDHGMIAFFAFFVTTLIVDGAWFWLVAYPGHICTDSFDQLWQIVTEQYTEHHPVYLTFLIKAVMRVGAILFDSPNAILATYTIFQIVFVSVCVAYCFYSLYMARLNRCILFISFILYVFYPLHINMSAFIKDTMFAASASLLTAAMFRLLSQNGSGWSIDSFILLVSAVGYGLFRPNGMYALILVVLLTFAILRLKHRNINVLLIVALLLTIILKGPILSGLEISTDHMGVLYIPAQMMGCALAEGAELSDYERDLLSGITEEADFSDIYDPYYARPVMEAVRTHEEFFVSHRSEYVRLWARLGLSHPLSYIHAWSDITYGYWYPGYQAGQAMSIKWAQAYQDYTQEPHSIEAYDLAVKHVDRFYGSSFWAIGSDMGIHFWLLLLTGVYCIFNRRKQVTISLPAICVVCVLILCSPFVGNIRYGYAVLTCFPVAFYGSMLSCYPADDEVVDEL